MTNKGIDSERKLLRELYSDGFVGVRTAGSGGGSSEPKPDVIVGKNGKHFAIELKTSSKDDIYIKDTQIDGLVEFARKFGAIPLICVKFTRLPYVFMGIRTVEHTGGHMYHISKKQAIYLASGKKYQLDIFT